MCLSKTTTLRFLYSPATSLISRLLRRSEIRCAWSTLVRSGMERNLVPTGLCLRPWQRHDWRKMLEMMQKLRQRCGLDTGKSRCGSEPIHRTTVESGPGSESRRKGTSVRDSTRICSVGLVDCWSVHAHLSITSPYRVVLDWDCDDSRADGSAMCILVAFVMLESRPGDAGES